MNNTDTKKLFVRNLPFSLDEEQLQRIFEQVGGVTSVSIPVDRDSGRKRGFAFVEMDTQAQAVEAVKSLNGSNIDGRQIVVNHSEPKPRQANSRW